MTGARTITHDNLAALVADLAAAGTRVTAPARGADGKVDYRPIASLAEAALGAELPRRSLKEFFLPASEPLFSWRQEGAKVDLRAVPTEFPPHLVLGARPCDAAAVEILDHVMGWDYRDELWFGRRAATTIATLACPGVDGSCFCTATGRGPESTKGSDLMLYPIDGGYLVEVVTPKGDALVTAHAARFISASDASRPVSPDPGPRTPDPASLPMPAIAEWLARNFEHELWRDIALRCHGCGACASVCPTCHCFDIVDEPEGVTEGTRRRNWDTCQTGLFTLHASGHNPRRDQHARIRQRVTHKFSIYPAKFGEVLCTGCGRCARACPGGMDLPEILGRIAALAGAASGPEAAV
ncbi:MAG TPA: 4Fe-4S dicluster domain-containing protein [Thermoanaerobaculaceae bacterium]|nr:4Fe-4S dicluster domain-containing protein [Thermoanaerobaculaceae bacterium]